jgi:signal transduction histidine kinase
LQLRSASLRRATDRPPVRARRRDGGADAGDRLGGDSALLERVIRRVERDAKAVDATLTLTAERVEGPWDRERLDRVFSSIVSDALKNAPRARIDVTVQKAPAGATVVVRDPGPGVRDEGLGLYMAKEIVIAHGGRIDVDSGSGGGSAFTVHLPLEVQ